MSEVSKGGLIKKTKKNPFERPKPVFKTEMDDFKFSQEKTIINEPVTPSKVSDSDSGIPAKVENKIIVDPPKRKKAVVGKNNNVKSLKVPEDIHLQLNLLGNFMGNAKTYTIISNLIQSYVKNELTDRQQRQFQFMTDAFNNEK